MSASDGQKDDTSASLSRQLDDVFGEDLALDSTVTAFLVGLSGRHAGKLFRLPAGVSIIGRSSRALVTLDEKAVSHQHAQLTLSANGCVVEDLKSTNGSYINDQPFTSPQTLNAGDVLRFGSSTLGFLTDAEDEEQHTRALARITQPTFGATPRPVPNAGSRGTAAHVVLSGAPHELALGADLDPQQKSPTQALDDILDKLDLALGFLGRYWKLLLITAIVCAGLGALTLLVKPPVATATFEILLHAEESESTQLHFATRSIDYFSSAERTFINKELVRQTLTDLKRSAPEGVVFATVKGLTFQQAGPGLYGGSFSDTDSHFAEAFLAQHLKNYLEREIGKSIKVLRSEVELLRTQYQDNDALLKRHEVALRDFKQQHLDALPDLAREQLASRASLIARKDALSAELTRASQELALSRKQLASEDAFVESNVERSQPYESSLATVRLNIAAARAKGYSGEHPELVKLKDEEAALIELRDRTVSSITTESDRRANPEHRQLVNRVGQMEVIVASTSQEIGQIDSRLGAINKVAGDMPEVEAELASKTREVEAARRLHGQLFDQLKAKELELQFERASVAARYEIIEPPSAFELDLTRSALKRAGVGAASGIALGILLALFHLLRTYVQRRSSSSITTTQAIRLADTSRDS